MKEQKTKEEKALESPVKEYTLTEDERQVFADVDKESQEAVRQAMQIAAQPYIQQSFGVLRVIMKSRNLPEGTWSISADGTKLIRKE
jgi:hypothetical protein